MELLILLGCVSDSSLTATSTKPTETATPEPETSDTEDFSDFVSDNASLSPGIPGLACTSIPECPDILTESGDGYTSDEECNTSRDVFIQDISDSVEALAAEQLGWGDAATLAAGQVPITVIAGGSQSGSESGAESTDTYRLDIFFGDQTQGVGKFLKRGTELPFNHFGCSATFFADPHSGFTGQTSVGVLDTLLYQAEPYGTFLYSDAPTPDGIPLTGLVILSDPDRNIATYRWDNTEFDGQEFGENINSDGALIKTTVLSLLGRSPYDPFNYEQKAFVLKVQQ